MHNFNKINDSTWAFWGIITRSIYILVFNQLNPVCYVSYVAFDQFYQTTIPNNESKVQRRLVDLIWVTDKIAMKI